MYFKIDKVHAHVRTHVCVQACTNDYRNIYTHVYTRATLKPSSLTRIFLLSFKEVVDRADLTLSSSLIRRRLWNSCV